MQTDDGITPANPLRHRTVERGFRVVQLWHRYAHSPCAGFGLKNGGQKITIEVAFQYYRNAIRMRGAQKDS